MDSQEQAFLSAALGIGDKRVERRLLVGFHLVRDCCRIADDDSWVARSAVAREAMDRAVEDGMFIPGDAELVAVAGLLTALDAQPRDRRALYSALSAYGVALARETAYGCARAVFELLDRLWDPTCLDADRMEALWFHGLTLIRGENPIELSTDVPGMLALLARRARSTEYLGLARLMQMERTFTKGNLQLGQRMGERIERWVSRRGSRRVEGLLLLWFAIVHGRAGRIEEVLRCANRVLAFFGDISPTARIAALHLAGMAMMDLGEYGGARAAFELLLLSPSTQYRRIGRHALLELAVRLGDREAFERAHARMLAEPLFGNQRIGFLEATGRGWLKFGDVARARAALDEAHALAGRYGHAYEIFEVEAQLAHLPDAEQVALSATILPAVAAHVTALRDSQAREIAECLA